MVDAYRTGLELLWNQALPRQPGKGLQIHSYCLYDPEIHKVFEDLESKTDTLMLNVWGHHALEPHVALQKKRWTAFPEPVSRHQHVFMDVTGASKRKQDVWTLQYHEKMRRTKCCKSGHNGLYFACQISILLFWIFFCIIKYNPNRALRMTVNSTGREISSGLIAEKENRHSWNHKTEKH